MPVTSGLTLVHLSNATHHTNPMLSHSFYLLGEAPASARTIEADENASLDDLKDLVASHFAIVVAEGKFRNTAAKYNCIWNCKLTLNRRWVYSW